MANKLASAISLASKLVDKRTASVVTTEVSQAFNDETLEATDTIAKLHPDIAKSFANMWDATLDKDTCNDCDDHDGEIVPLGTDYYDGAEPGDIHPNCRCVSFPVMLEVPFDDSETIDSLKEASEEADETIELTQ